MQSLLKVYHVNPHAKLVTSPNLCWGCYVVSLEALLLLLLLFSLYCRLHHDEDSAGYVCFFLSVFVCLFVIRFLTN
jgi:hypothetical protein